MTPLFTELERRWLAMFAALAAGDDVPPSQRLRAEGMMEAALVLQPDTAGRIDAAMARCYQRALGRAIEADFGSDWREFYPFPQIPAMGCRAPVYPSADE
jgi:hypothetical protein